jgi:transcriptional regulator with XRE-family HTH domain
MKIIAVDDEGKEISLPPVDSIVDFIKQNRKCLRMSLQDIAKVVGVKRQAVWSWEQGKTVPTVENLVMLVKAFGQKGTQRPSAPKKESAATVGVKVSAPATPAKSKVEVDMNRNLKLAEEILDA